MLRSVATIAACLFFALSRAFAQSEIDAWKDLIVKASYAAEARDYAKAEQIYSQALHEAERFGPDDPRVATSLNGLGDTYRKEKKFAEAETAFRRSYSILEKASGIDSMDLANVNLNLAGVMFDEGRQSMAIPFLQKTLATYEALLDANDEKIASVVCMLGDAYRLERDFRAAEDPLKRCASIRERNGGIQNADLATALHSLALVYVGEERYELAEPRVKLAEKIRESTLGITSLLLAQTMEDHATILRQLGREKEAAQLETMATAIRRSQKGRAR
jgi:tetratricopeptide (TPR) repeat protein